MKFYATLILFFAFSIAASAQTDAAIGFKETVVGLKEEIVLPFADTTKPAVAKPIKQKDTVAIKAKPKHDPKIATRRSLIFPGLGQIYNREYWKLPLVYGALSIPTVTFIYNNTWYKRTKFAYEAKYAAAQTTATHQDTLNLQNINSKLTNLSIGSLQSYRNIFRRNRDYSILWFVIVWGLNVADATVFAHLKQFDVSDNLALQVRPNINPLSKNNELKFSFSFKKPAHRMIDVSR